MLEGKPTPAGSGHAAAGYSYPGDLALFVRDRWRDVPEPTTGDVAPLPDTAALEGFFAACYQASMLREEERPVTFRAILAEPALFAPEGRPPEGLQRLEFPRSIPFDPRELRRLSVAADSQRTLIGIWRDGEGGLRIWGLINSGTRWLRDVQGGRRAGAPLPSAPVVHVGAPGSIEAYRGHELLGKLQGGNSRAQGWTPSSRNGCRASSPISWRISWSGTRPPVTARASLRARGGRRWSRRFRTGLQGA
jgi:sensor domain DACNV-containing protein